MRRNSGSDLLIGYLFLGLLFGASWLAFVFIRAIWQNLEGHGLAPIERATVIASIATVAYYALK